MDRRAFLIAPIALAGATFQNSVEGKILNAVCGLNDIQLGGKSSYLAKSGATFLMPKNPQHGDTLTIAVDRTSLTNPCQLKDPHNKIVGENEPLILNCLAIFTMKFDGVSKNWTLA